MAQTAQTAMEPTLAPSHCAVLAHLSAGLVPVLVQHQAHDPLDAVVEGSRVGLVAGRAANAGWWWSLSHILNDALPGEVERVEDFGVQYPPAIIDPARQVGRDLLGTQIVATHLARDGHRPKGEADEDAGNDGCDEIVGEPCAGIAKRLE